MREMEVMRVGNSFILFILDILGIYWVRNTIWINHIAINTIYVIHIAVDIVKLHIPNIYRFHIMAHTGPFPMPWEKGGCEAGSMAF